MSVVHIDGIKNQNGVFPNGVKSPNNFSFAVSHQKVVVEDAISRCPEACREPTQAELDWKKKIMNQTYYQENQIWK